MVPWKCVKMFKHSRARGQRERLTKAFRGEGFSVIGQLSFRLWRGGRGGLEWFSVRGWRRLCRESEGEGALRIPCANNSHRVRGLCLPFLCRLSPCTRASHWFVKMVTTVYFHMVRQISSEMFLIWGSRGWSKMRAEGDLRGWHTDDFQEKQSSNWKDNQGIEWNKLLFLVPELQHRNVQENNPRLSFFLCCQRLPNQSPLVWSIGKAWLFKTDQCHWVHSEWHTDSINGAIQTFLLALVLAAPSTAAPGPARLKEPPITLVISIACDELLSVQWLWNYSTEMGTHLSRDGRIQWWCL